MQKVKFSVELWINERGSWNYPSGSVCNETYDFEIECPDNVIEEDFIEDWVFDERKKWDYSFLRIYDENGDLIKEVDHDNQN